MYVKVDVDMVSTKCMTNQKVGNKKFWENRAFGIYEKQRKAQIRIACFYGFTGWSFAKDDILWLHNLFIVKLQTQSEGLGADMEKGADARTLSVKNFEICGNFQIV